jgi:hypothetical protein
VSALRRAGLLAVLASFGCDDWSSLSAHYDGGAPGSDSGASGSITFVTVEGIPNTTGSSFDLQRPVDFEPGDVLLVAVSGDNGGVSSPGWNLRARFGTFSNYLSKVASQNDPPYYHFDVSRSAGPATVLLLSYRGVKTSSSGFIPSIENERVAPNGCTSGIGGITTQVPNTWLVLSYTIPTNNSDPMPSGTWRQRINLTGLTVFDRVQPTPATTSSVTIYDQDACDAADTEIDLLPLSPR